MANPNAQNALFASLIVAIFSDLCAGFAIGSSGTTDDSKNYGNFEEKQRFTIGGSIPVTLHTSSKTGLSIVHAEIKQPLTEGQICLVTESSDADGLPHALEHLIFMGSKKYPYKGALDMIGNRCLSAGTNAWTSVDHTCYKMKTAGSEGFLNLLPIFLDHILNPTLNDSFFVTEVHHVNGEGQDGGVVFSEMKGRYSHPGRQIIVEAIRLVFSGCAYQWDAGGKPHNIRTSTNNDKIREYHRKFYRPDNMVLTVTGSVDKKRLFDSIQSVEEEEKAKERDTFEKPFSGPCPPLPGVVKKELEYLDEEEKFGKVSIYWRVDEIIGDRYLVLAHIAMAKYLSTGVSSPLQKAFVETISPLATSVFLDVGWILWIQLYCDNVPIDKLDEITPAYFSLMRKEMTSDFDLERMRGILRQTLSRSEEELENDPGDFVQYSSLFSLIVDDNMERFHNCSSKSARIENLLKEDESFWRETMRTFSREDEMVILVARPSKRKLKEMEETEKNFVENRIRELGRDGLEEKARILKEAKDKNDAVLVPRDILASIPIPSADSIVLPEVITVRSRRLHPDAALQLPKNADVITNLVDVLDLPYAIQISQYRSPFIRLQAVAHASQLGDDLMPYLELYNTLIFQTDVRRGDTIVSHEEIDLELTRETNEVSSAVGPRTGTISVTVGVEKKKFLRGLQYLREGVTQQIFTKDRLRHFVTFFNNSFPSTMRDPDNVVEEVMRPMILTNDSNERLLSIVSQRKLLSSIADDVRDNGAREILGKFRKITDFITDPKRVALFVSGDVKSVVDDLKTSRGKDFAEILDEYLGPFRRSGDPPSSSVCLAYRPYSEFRLPALPGTSLAKVVAMATEETARFEMVSLIDVGSDHPDWPILKVISNYFHMKEGPLWRQIRGLGLAYGFYFRYNALTGFGRMGAQKAVDVVRVYKEMKGVVDALTEEESGDMAVEALAVEAAKSTRIFDLVATTRRKSPSSAYVATATFVNCFHGRSLNFTGDSIDRTLRVSKADVRRVMRERVQPFFDPKGATRIVVAANPSKVEQIARDFRQMDLAVDMIDLERMIANNER